MQHRVSAPLRAAAILILACAPADIASVRSEAAAPPEPFIIDHRAVAEFGQLAEREIQAAAGLRMIVRTASIGVNIDNGLNCLMNSFAGRPRRPNSCDRGLAADQVVYGSRFDRRNWAIEFRGNPGWYGKVSDFVARVDGLSPADNVDVVAFNLNYADGLPGLVAQFFTTDPHAPVGNVATLEALEQRHGDLVFVWWSMPLPRRSTSEMQQFNRRIRAYARERKKVLFDIADIESHDPTGAPCTDNQGQGLEAICPQYTDERNNGHLNARGTQRAAKALWVLMARLAK